MTDIDGPRLDAEFVDAGGVARDRFAIEKGEAAGPAALAGSEAAGPVS